MSAYRSAIGGGLGANTALAFMCNTGSTFGAPSCFLAHLVRLRLACADLGIAASQRSAGFGAYCAVFVVERYTSTVQD